MMIQRTATAFFCLFAGAAIAAPAGRPDEQARTKRVRRGLINVAKQNQKNEFQRLTNEFGEGDRDLQEEDMERMMQEMSFSMGAGGDGGMSMGMGMGGMSMGMGGMGMGMSMTPELFDEEGMMGMEDMVMEESGGGFSGDEAASGDGADSGDGHATSGDAAKRSKGRKRARRNRA